MKNYEECIKCPVWDEDIDGPRRSGNMVNACDLCAMTEELRHEFEVTAE